MKKVIALFAFCFLLSGCSTTPVANWQKGYQKLEQKRLGKWTSLGKKVDQIIAQTEKLDGIEAIEAKVF